MRTFVKHGLAAVAAVVLAACSNSQPQPARDPINANPTPQQAINDPKPQARGPGLSIDDKGGKPMSDPSVQQPALQAPSSQQAITDPQPQKPFYGPGLVSPEERDQQRAKQEKPLASDGEVLAFAVAVNDGEIQMAELAKKNATSTEVKQFASMMQTHHTQGMNKIRTVQGKAKVQLADNDLSAKVKGDAQQNMATLRDKKGKEFDRLYIDTQVRMHKEALDAIDAKVVPAAQNGEVKAQVTEMRRQVSDHLNKAQDIQKKLDPTTAAARTDDASTVKGKSDVDDKASQKAQDAKQDAKKKGEQIKEDVKH